MGQKNDPRNNASGYRDLTAYEAIEKVERERRSEWERLNNLLQTIFYICDLAGYHVEERIVLKDKKNGKVWR